MSASTPISARDDCLEVLEVLLVVGECGIEERITKGYRDPFHFHGLQCLEVCLDAVEVVEIEEGGFPFAGSNSAA